MNDRNHPRVNAGDARQGRAGNRYRNDRLDKQMRSNLYERYDVNVSSSHGVSSASRKTEHFTPSSSSSISSSASGRSSRSWRENRAGAGSSRPSSSVEQLQQKNNRLLLFVAVVLVFAITWKNIAPESHMVPQMRAGNDYSENKMKQSSTEVSSSNNAGIKSTGGGGLFPSLSRQQSLKDLDNARNKINSLDKKKRKRWNPCTNTKYELERHDHEPRHGDICRLKGGMMGLYECPEGCHETAGVPPFCAKGEGGSNTKGGGPCRVRDPNAPPEYRCDDAGVCILAVGSPKEQFKGKGVYYDDTCDGKCGDGRRGEVEPWISNGKTCSSDWDCSLAGVCTPQGTCQCDPWAEGADCSYIKFQPVDKSRLGYLDENHSSWGGSIVQSAANGKYYMYLSEILCKVDPDVRKRCGLENWQTHSRVVVASSTNLDGPYQRLNEVLHPEHHNPSIHVSPKTGHWHLYTISGPSGPIERIISTDFGRSWSVPSTVSPRQNPGPLLKEDGSTLLYYRADGIDLPSPTCSDEGISIQICPSDDEPCKPPNDIPILEHTGEDPSVFIDHRGNYHMLFNALPYKCVPKLQQGGHAWSKDGWNWSTPRVGAFDTTIKFTDGTKIKCERRERPQMVLGKDGRPLSMVSAVTGCPKALGGGLDESFEEGGGRHYRGGDDCFTLVQKVGIDAHEPSN